MNENPQQPTGFFDGIRQTNLTRSEQRWIGGVSHAIAARTRLDISLVRGLFVIAALFGVGFLLYGLGWIFLPEEGSGRIIAEDLGRGRVDAALIGAGAFIVLGLWAPFSLTNAVFGAPWLLIPNGLGIAILVIVVLVIIAKNSEQKHAPRPGEGAPGGADGGTAGAAGDVGGTSSAAPNPGAHAQESTDEFGVGTGAPQTQPLSPQMQPGPTTAPLPPGASVPPGPPVPPVPPTPPRPTHKRASLALISAVIGVALIAAAVVALPSLDSDRFWVTPVGVGVIVIGIGIILAGFLGRTSSVLSPLAIVALFLTVSGSMGWIGSGPVIGDISWKPTALTSAKTVKTTAVGNVTVDLTDVPPSETVHEVDVRFMVGDATVVIPNDRHVLVTTALSVGDIEVIDHPDDSPSGVIVGKHDYSFGENFSEYAELKVSIGGLVGDITVRTADPATSEVQP